jgi:hypothetical protein
MLYLFQGVINNNQNLNFIGNPIFLDERKARIQIHEYRS